MVEGLSPEEQLLTRNEERESYRKRYFKRRAFLDALDVNYDDLPERVESPAPNAQPKPQPKARQDPTKGLRFPPQGYATPLGLFTYNAVRLTEEQRDSLKRLGYIVKAPGMGIVGIVRDTEQKARFKERFSFIKHVFTLPEAVSFLALDEKVTNPKQAAELLASPPPAEAVLPPPSPPAADKPWVDDEDPFANYGDGDDDDDDVFAN